MHTAFVVHQTVGPTRKVVRPIHQLMFVQSQSSGHMNGCLLNYTCFCGKGNNKTDVDGDLGNIWFAGTSDTSVTLGLYFMSKGSTNHIITIINTYNLSILLY